MSNATPNLPQATFSAAKGGGVKTFIEYRGFPSRIAFPSEKFGGQPEDGETWTYIVLSENRAKTIWVIRCVDRVSEASQPASSVVTNHGAEVDVEIRARQILDEPHSASLKQKTVKLGDWRDLMRSRAACTDHHIRAVAGGLEQVLEMIADTSGKEKNARASLAAIITGSFEQALNAARRVIELRAEGKNLSADDRPFNEHESELALCIDAWWRNFTQAEDGNALHDLARVVMSEQLETVVTLVGELDDFESTRLSLRNDLADLIKDYEDSLAKI